MPPTLSKSPTKTRSKTTTVPQTSTSFPPRIKDFVQSYPVAIGTRGTVGSLIIREMEYFSRLELGSRKLASSGDFSRPKPESIISTCEKKKRGSKRLIPSMCSMVEVAESKQPKASMGFAYRNLKADVKRSQT